MKIAIAGTGYVGFVTAVCLAEHGHDVTCVDVDKKKIVLPEPIKTLGKHEISIRLHKDVLAKLDVEVVEE